jgi:chromosome segregation ATPase
MTSEQKYSEVLKELGALLADKNAIISSQKWQIGDLQEKLAKAEQELKSQTENLTSCAVKLAAARAEIEELKGGAA